MRSFDTFNRIRFLLSGSKGWSVTCEFESSHTLALLLQKKLLTAYLQLVIGADTGSARYLGTVFYLVLVLYDIEYST
jgi:hypothetical protein